MSQDQKAAINSVAEKELADLLAEVTKPNKEHKDVIDKLYIIDMMIAKRQARSPQDDVSQLLKVRAEKIMEYGERALRGELSANTAVYGFIDFHKSTYEELYQYCLANGVYREKTMPHGLLGILLEKGKGTEETLVVWMTQRAAIWCQERVIPRFNWSMMPDSEEEHPSFVVEQLQADIEFFKTQLARFQGNPYGISCKLALRLMQSLQRSIVKDLKQVYRSNKLSIPQQVRDFFKETDQLCKKFESEVAAYTVANTSLITESFYKYWGSLYQQLQTLTEVTRSNFKTNPDLKPIVGIVGQYCKTMTLFGSSQDKRTWLVKVDPVDRFDMLAAKDAKEAKLSLSVATPNGAGVSQSAAIDRKDGPPPINATAAANRLLQGGLYELDPATLQALVAQASAAAKQSAASSRGQPMAPLLASSLQGVLGGGAQSADEQPGAAPESAKL